MRTDYIEFFKMMKDSKIDGLVARKEGDWWELFKVEYLDPPLNIHTVVWPVDSNTLKKDQLIPISRQDFNSLLFGECCFPDHLRADYEAGEEYIMSDELREAQFAEAVIAPENAGKPALRDMIMEIIAAEIAITEPGIELEVESRIGRRPGPFQLRTTLQNLESKGLIILHGDSWVACAIVS